MTANQYREMILRLGLTVASAGRFFGVNPRTGRRWAETGPSRVVIQLLLVMDNAGLSPAQVSEIVRRHRFPVGRPKTTPQS